MSFFLLCALLTFAQKITPLTQKKYKDVGNVTSKFAYVFDGKKWGVIDETGAEIIPLVYDSICNGIDNYYKNFN